MTYIPLLVMAVSLFPFCHPFLYCFNGIPRLLNIVEFMAIFDDES